MPSFIKPVVPLPSGANQYAIKITSNFRSFLDDSLKIGGTQITVSEQSNYSDELEKLIGEINEGAESLADDFVSSTAKKHADDVSKSIISAMGVDLGQYILKHKYELEVATKYNTLLIKGLNNRTHERIESLMFRALTDSTIRLTDELKKIKKTYASSAKLIARDQGNKIISNLNQLRMRDLYQDSYIWSTSNDDRVRKTHVDNDKKEFSWDIPPATTGHVGQDIQCRCVARQVFNLDSFINKKSTGDSVKSVSFKRINQAIKDNLVDDLNDGDKVDYQILKSASFNKEDPVYTSLNFKNIKDLEVGSKVTANSMQKTFEEITSISSNTVFEIVRPNTVNTSIFYKKQKKKLHVMPHGIRGKVISIESISGKKVITVV